MKAAKIVLIAVIVAVVGFWAAGSMAASAQEMPGGEQPEKAVKKPERKQSRGHMDHGQMNREMNPEAQKRIVKQAREQFRKQAQAMKKLAEEVKKLKREMAALKKMRNQPVQRQRALRHEVPPRRQEGQASRSRQPGFRGKRADDHGKDGKQGRAGKRKGFEGRSEQAQRKMKQMSPEQRERFRERMRDKAKQLSPEQKERTRERIRERNPDMRERGREQQRGARPERRRRA